MRAFRTLGTIPNHWPSRTRVIKDENNPDRIIVDGVAYVAKPIDFYITLGIALSKAGACDKCAFQRVDCGHISCTDTAREDRQQVFWVKESDDE